MAKTKNPPKKKIKEKSTLQIKSTNTINTSSSQQPSSAEKKKHSWAVVRSIFTCKHLQTQMHLLQQHQPQTQPQTQEQQEEKKHIKMKYCSGSLCNNTKVMQRPVLDQSADLSNNVSCHRQSSSSSMKISLRELNNGSSSSFSSTSSNSFSGSFKAMPFRKLSGCYECKMVVDPGICRDPFFRANIFPCSVCGEIFMKAENLDLHQATRHAVSELGADDASKNIVEIIFQSSWLKKQNLVCVIDRILKIHNTSKTITRFEEYRDSMKSKATKLPKKHPRCIADGNELLRFHCTTFTCSLGLNGSSNLCNSIPRCNICSIIKSGFRVNSGGELPTTSSSSSSSPGGLIRRTGILTTATSGKAHDNAKVTIKDDKRAMLVCRVIAGRVKRNLEGNVEDYDSIGGDSEVYSNLDELYVFNTKAILPCFVVIYRAL